MTGTDNALSATPGAGGTITELVSGVINDAQKLVKQQIDMFKSEFKEDLSRTKKAAVLGGISIAALAVGGFALIFAIVAILERVFPSLPPWGAWSLFSGVFLAVGIVLGLMARNLFESFNPLPDKTFNALTENLTWKTEPQA